MLARMLAFAAGILCLLQLPTLPPVVLSGLGIPVLLLAWRCPKLQLGAFFCLGICWTLLVSGLSLNRALPQALEQKDIVIEGLVTSLPEQFGNVQRFRFAITSLYDADGNRQPFVLPVRLSWYSSQHVIKPGQHWRFTVRLKKPWGFMNPGGFDYEFWLFRQGIRALGYVRQPHTAVLLDDEGGVPVARARYRIANAIKQQVAERYQGLLLALSIGERSQLNQEQRNLLNLTGTSHLIAISGLHLGLVAALAFFLCRWGWSRFPVLTNIFAAPMFASVAALVIATIYAFIAGMSLPTQRALIMIAVVLLMLLCKRSVAMSQVLAIAAMLVLVRDPFAIHAPDFWLSFMAVAFILFLLHGRKRVKGKIHSWFYLQITLGVSLFPLLIASFNQLPLYSVLANSVAIPLIGMIVVPLTLLATACLFTVPALADVIYTALFIPVDIFWYVLQLLQQLPGNHYYIAGSSFITLAAAIIGVLILFMPRGLPSRWIGGVFLLPMLFPVVSKPDKGEFDFVLLDVGQGLAGLVKTQNYTMLFDSGARFSPRFDIGSAVINPYMRYTGIKQLDTLVVSHGDNDHIGGAEAVINAYPPANILSSVPHLVNVHKGGLCHYGQTWARDGVEFRVLYPVSREKRSDNNSSCVVKVSGKYGALLLTGDIEQLAEADLLEWHGHKLAADILVVPHHGSLTSSSPAFIRSVRPKEAWIAAGYRNRFGLPNQDIITRYRSHGIEPRVSYKSGALRAEFREQGINIHEFRPEQRRFWHNDE